MGIQADVAVAGEMQDAVNYVVEKWGALDLAIANAGVSQAGWAAKQSPADVQRLFSINFMGMVNLFSPIIPQMIENKQGHLVGIASIASYRGLPALSAYSASKAAMRSYLETLRIELKSRGVLVSTICPGYFQTDMTADRSRPMPFMMTVEKTASQVMKAIDSQASEVIFPFPLAVSTKLLNFLPNRLYDMIIRYF